MPDLTLREENLIWRLANGDMKVPITEWCVAMSKMAWSVHAGQVLKLEVPAQTHVPYLDN